MMAVSAFSVQRMGFKSETYTITRSPALAALFNSILQLNIFQL